MTKPKPPIASEPLRNTKAKMRRPESSSAIPPRPSRPTGAVIGESVRSTLPSSKVMA